MFWGGLFQNQAAFHGINGRWVRIVRGDWNHSPCWDDPRRLGLFLCRLTADSLSPEPAGGGLGCRRPQGALFFSVPPFVGDAVERARPSSSLDTPRDPPRPAARTGPRVGTGLAPDGLLLEARGGAGLVTGPGEGLGVTPCVPGAEPIGGFCVASVGAMRSSAPGNGEDTRVRGPQLPPCG